jgi:hypothetical protein
LAVQPLAVAEIGFPGVLAWRPPALPGECRDDLLSVDGQPVAVRLVGSTDAALDGRGVRIETCGGPLALEPGDHVVRTARGRDSGVHLDRLVLASDPGGAPAALDAAGAPVLPPAATAPRLTVLETGDTSMRVRVAASDAPYWMVLGQSENSGWRLEEAGGRSFGRSTLVDGYANGWYVGTGDGAAREFTITWTPQRSVNLSLVVSLLGALACVALVVRGRRWRRDPGLLALPADDGPAPAGDGSAAECGPSAGCGSSDETPVPTLPFVRHGGVRWYLTVTAAVAVGGATAAVVAPSVGAGMAAAVVVAAAWRRGRWVLAAAAIGLAVAATARVVDVRSSNPDERSFELFTRLQRPHWLVLAAVMALVADAVVSTLGNRARPAPGEAAGEVEAPDAEHAEEPT